MLAKYLPPPTSYINVPISEKKNIFLNVRGMRLSPERSKYGMRSAEDISFLNCCYDHITWYIYKLCCPVCNDLPL